MQSRKIGRYEILEELGQGATGRRYLAGDPEADRRVALKILHIDPLLPVAEREAWRERCLGQARAASHLLHPYIATLFDIGEDDGEIYFATELVPGDSLESHVRAPALLPVGTAIELIAAAAETLAYAHDMGLVHRNIKPSHLARVAESAVKVLDFGLGCTAEAHSVSSQKIPETPDYMSPEQVAGREIDGRSDLFSLAAVLFELLAGEKPFPGETTASIVYRIVNEPPREPAARNRFCPELSAFLARALAKSPAERFPDGRAFAEALRAAGAESPAAASGDAFGTPAVEDTELSGKIELTTLPRSRGRRRRRSSAGAYGFVAIVLLVVVAGLGYGFRDRLGWSTPHSVPEPVPLPTPPPEVLWEARVRTEPPDLSVTLDGEPLDSADDGVVRFRPDGPFGVLAVAEACRAAEHQLSPADAGQEIVLVLDAPRLRWTIDPGVAGATVRINGQRVGETPLEIDLDLCEGNRVEVESRGFRPSAVDLPAGATPLDGRTLLAALGLETIPMGQLVLPPSEMRLVYYLDGRRLAESETQMELPEGEYEVRFKNEGYWIDERRRIRVSGGKTTEPELDIPVLATLVVQAYPANCKVFLRRPDGKWRFFDDTPARRRVAIGPYEVRVQLNPTGEVKEREVELRPGNNPPVRVAFGRSS